MLQKLNERLQGVIAWVIILLLALTFAFFGVDYYMQSHQTADDKATVNGKPLSKQEFEVNYRRLRSQQELGHLSAEDEKRLQEQVLTQMITNEATVQAARHYGFEVGANQADAAIVHIPQFQDEGHFSSEKYQQVLSSALFTPESFQREVRQGMLINQQRFALIGTAFALPEEVGRFVNLYMQTRDFDYLKVPSAQFEKQVQVSEEEIKKYYNAHLKEFMSQEQVSVDYLRLSLSDLRANAKVSNEDIQTYYEENKANYLIPARWTVSHILFAIPKGASTAQIQEIKKKADAVYAKLVKDPIQFETMLHSMSDDKLSLPKKGVLPVITGAQTDYANVLSTLTKAGDLSKPTKTKYGFEIFKVLAYEPMSQKTLEQMKPTIKEQLANEAAQTQYTHLLEKLSDLSYQMPDSLNEVAAALKLNIQQSEFFSRTDGLSPLTKNELVVRAAFSHDVLDLGNNSEALNVDNDSVIVLRVNAHREAKVQPLALVQEKIKQILIRKTAEEKAKKVGLNLLNPHKTQQAQDLEVQENQLKWHSITAASRDSESPSLAINALAFNLQKPGMQDGASLNNGDYVVVRLKKINPGNLHALDQEQRAGLVQQIETSYGLMDYDLYVAGLVHQAQIVKH